MEIRTEMIVPLAILSAIFYRLGGWGDEGREDFPWLPEWLFNTKARDIGCPLCCLGWMLLNVKSPWWVHFIAFGALFGCLTTYWDFLTGEDNFWLHGFMCGFAYLPYAMIHVSYLDFLLRCVALAIGMGGLCAIFGDDIVEEGIRGSLLVLTLPILLL